MTSIVDTGKRAAMLATVGGIGAIAAILVLAGQKGLPPLSLDERTVKLLWGLATAGVFWATVFNWLFEKWIWRLSILQGWLVKVPDLSGTWKGTSESRYFKNSNGAFQKIEISVRIDHRFDRIVYTQQGVTTSRAFVADLSVDGNGFYTLVVAYENPLQPNAMEHVAANAEFADNVRDHCGCARMILKRPPEQRAVTRNWELSGHYWTNKRRSPNSDDRGTWGVLELWWQS